MVMISDPDGARMDYTHMWGADDLEFLSRYDGLQYFRLTRLAGTPAVRALVPVAIFANRATRLQERFAADPCVSAAPRAGCAGGCSAADAFSQTTDARPVEKRRKRVPVQEPQGAVAPLRSVPTGTGALT